MSASEWVKDVAEADFEREVLEASQQRPVVVDFWAPWCEPCQMLGPLLEQLAAERNGDFVLAKVNVDEAQDLAAYFGIEGIPAVKAFRGGQPVLEFVGLLPEPQLRQFIDQICPSETDRLVERAAGLETADPGVAEQLYRRVLEQDRDYEAAIVGLTRLLIARSRDEEASELIERIGPRGEQGEEYERLSALLFIRRQGREFGDPDALRRRSEKEPDNARLRYELGCALARAGRYPEALEQLLAAAERDRTLAKSQVREVMVKIFHVVGVRSELADDYRDKLSRLLY